MKMLEYTGERVIPELMKPMNGLLLEHLARYEFAIPYVHGRVLDIACGSGYGTQLIAKVTKKKCHAVIGVDIDEKTIEYARKRYNHPLIQYQQEDALNSHLPEKLGSFDTILSFETIEHFSNDRLFIKNIYDMLRPKGVFIISTPFGKGRGKPCGSPFHVHQFTKNEFRELLTPFQNVEIYHQRGVLIEPPKKDGRYPLGVAVCTK